MRWTLARGLVALWALAGCSRDTSVPGLGPLIEPDATAADVCTMRCGDNDVDASFAADAPASPPDSGAMVMTPVDSGMPPPPPDAGNPPARDRDPMELVSFGSDNFGGFFEPIEIQVLGDTVGVCTGVRGLALYTAADPCCVSLERSLIPPQADARYPRCQHFAFGVDRVVITSRGDEIQPTPFLSVLDTTDLDAAVPLDARFDDIPYEGVTIHQDVVYVAQHELGLGVYRMEGDGTLTPITTVTDGVSNAWQPLVDAGGGVLYLADAQGGVGVYSLADPLDPQLMIDVPTVGTVKELVLVGDYAYTASGVAGMEVIDVSDPGAAHVVRRMDTPGSAIGIAAEHPHVVIADWNQVLLFRLDDPAAPTRVGHQRPYATAGFPDASGRVLDVALSGNTVFMAEWRNIQAHQIIEGAQSADLLALDTVELPRAAAGDTSVATLAFENLGERDLEISGVHIDPPFIASLSHDTVAPGGGALVSIGFTAPSEAAERGLLIIGSNDPDAPELRVPVRANLPGLRTGDAVPPGIAFTDLATGVERRLDEQLGQVVLLAYFATF